MAVSRLSARKALSSSVGTVDQPRRLAVGEQRERGVHQRDLGLGVLVAGLALLRSGVDPPFEAGEVGQHQLGFDRLGVGDRIDLALDMGDVAVLEAAQHMDDGVDLADIGEELVAEALRPWRRRAPARRCRRS